MNEAAGAPPAARPEHLLAEGVGREAVEVPGFSGTLEGLVLAAQRGDVDLDQVNLAELTDDFDRRLSASEPPDPGRIADFLGFAARLVELKAQRLLPGPETEPAGPAEAEDGLLEEDLARRLELYRVYREAAERIMAWHQEDRASFTGLPLDLGEIEEELELDLERLVAAFQRTLRRLPSPEMDVVQPAYTVEEKVAEIEAALRQRAGRMDFTEVFERARDRMEAVALFLALLELLKRRVLSVRQASPGSEIEVRLR
ncbi:MAG: segregation and condensation protein A [Candidatus Dormibacteria bacterium]